MADLHYWEYTFPGNIKQFNGNREVVMKRAFLVLILTVLVFNSQVRAGAIVKDQTLSLDHCLEIALERHPDIRGSEAAIRAMQSRVRQVETEWNPDAGLSSSYNRRSVTDKGYDRYSSRLSVSAMLSDGGRTRLESSIARLQLKISEVDYDAVVQDLLYEVKQSYFNFLKALKTEEVAVEAVRLYEQRLEQAIGFYEVGRVPRYDVTTAEVNLSRKELELVKARTAVRTALSSLKNAIGLPEAPDFSVEDMLLRKEIDLNYEDVLTIALEMRPHLRAGRIESLSARKSVSLAAKANNPVLKANAGYSWGDEDFTGNDDLSLGVSLNVALYDGGLAKEKTREAEYRLEEKEADLQSLEQDVVLEVEKAFMEVEDSGEAIDTAAKAVEQAVQNLELANGRYEVGVGSPVEVTDATENYISATNSYYSTFYDYWLALAALEKATGGIIE